jgi:hypothetical protein
LDQVRRLKALEQENTRLRKAVAELTLEKLVLKECEHVELGVGAYPRPEQPVTPRVVVGPAGDGPAAHVREGER